MNQNLWIGIVVIIIVLVGGYFLFNKPESANGEVVKIGAAVCLTGVCAPFGEGELRAYQLAIDEANEKGGIEGKQIQLVSENTSDDPKSVTTAIQKLISVDGVNALLGPTWGDSFQGGYPIINGAKIAAVTPSTAFESLFYNKQPVDYAFSTWFTEREEIEVIQKYAESIGHKRIALLHDEDTFGAMMADLFNKAAPSHGIQIVKEYKFSPGYSDFRTDIAELKNLKPDAIFVSFLGPETKAKFMKQAYELGLKAQVYSSADIESPPLLESFGSVMEGVIYGFPEVTGLYAEFAQKYKERYGVEPEGPSAANAYDAANILIAALIAHEKEGTEVASALEKISLLGAAVSEVKFDANHQLATSKWITKTIRDGKFVVLEP